MAHRPGRGGERRTSHRHVPHGVTCPGCAPILAWAAQADGCDIILLDQRHGSVGVVILHLKKLGHSREKFKEGRAPPAKLLGDQ